ncbi:MAG TPA: hypothetical protein VMI31_06110, partial [Fimbriimonadaceae bacterium]|nr:hypothetical protein [Fimbriimonadaceae bacterium]
YEWRFYAALPLIAGLATLRKSSAWLLLAPFVFLGVDNHFIAYQWPFYSALALIGLILAAKRSMAWLVLVPFFLLGFDSKFMIFPFGMLAAHLVNLPALKRVLVSRASSVAVLLVIPAIWLFVKDGYSLLSETMCFSAFLPIAAGNDLFGLLRLGAAKHLGTISYSTYLLHCLFLYMVYRTLGLGPKIVSMGPISFWMIMTLFVGCIVVLSAVTYSFVERPFMSARRSSETAQGDQRLSVGAAALS